MGDPFEDGIDIEEINHEAFVACRDSIEDVRTLHRSSALTLFGEAGTGKTHLLGRVRRWLQTGPDSLFVPVRMDTNARMVWRLLRRSLADALLRPNATGEQPLERLLRRKQGVLNEVPERDLGIVLEDLLAGKHVRDASAWLRGQELPEGVLDRMELAQPGPEENQEVTARNLVRSLCSLLEPAVVVICLDQWEALQSAANDTEGFFAAGQAVSFLHDPPLRNVAILCCVQTGFMQKLETVLDEPTRDRLLRYRGGIDLLDWKKARRLISARLDEVPALSEMRRGRKDPLWPLAEDSIRQVFTANAAPARKVLFRCKDLFDVWRTGREDAVEEWDAFLRRMLEERMTPVAAADADVALKNGLPLMLKALAGSPAARGQGVFDFVFRNGGQLIAVCNQTNATSLAARLKKIGDEWKPANGQSLIILRDTRLPISEKAEKTRQRLKAIEDKGGRFVAVSQEAVESLAALRRLLADAQSGDLAYRGDGVDCTRVEAWIASHLPASLDPLMTQIDVPDLLSPKLADLLAQRKIVSLAQAAEELQSLPEEVEACARRDPRLFGMLGGSIPVLFQLVEVGSVPAESAE